MFLKIVLAVLAASVLLFVRDHLSIQKEHVSKWRGIHIPVTPVRNYGDYCCVWLYLNESSCYDFSNN